MRDSNRTSASIGFPTPIDDGTPAGNPTPAGEPSQKQKAGRRMAGPIGDGGMTGSDNPSPETAIAAAIGQLVLAWGALEHATAEKLAAMRQAFGDVRAVGGRARPTIPKLLAELRALVAMRDRHDKQALTAIAEIDGALQRIAQFRQLVVEGAQSVEGGAVLCRDIKNGPHIVPITIIQQEAERIAEIRARIEGL